jgi:carboxyl-terminal processing protease
MKPLFCLTGILLSLSVFAETPKVEKSTLENKARFEQLELFNKVLYLVETQYYRKVDTEKLVEGAIKGMLETLDPHSAFLNKDLFQRMKKDSDGEFDGLGLEVSVKDGYIIVLTPIEDSPAEKAGIKPKDRIVQINHESILGVSIDQAVEKMKGKLGSVVHLAITREGKSGLLHFNLKRQLIKVKPVKYEMIMDRVAYVRLSQFQRHAAPAVEEALKQLKEVVAKKGGFLGIILDLRSNPGGFLDQAVDVASIFLKDGIVVSTESRDPQNKDIRYVKKKGFKDLDTPMAVLINGGSASAAEIVAGALQDYRRAVIMGAQSFGKGSVQTVAPLDLGTGIKLTVAQYMTPKNRKIQAVGISPDISLEDIDQAKFDRIVKDDRFIREKDLRNYLTATIETMDETKSRESMEREERKKRAEWLEQRAKLKNKVEVEEDENQVKKPSEDYQVTAAARFLIGFNKWKTISQDPVK